MTIEPGERRRRRALERAREAGTETSGAAAHGRRSERRHARSRTSWASRTRRRRASGPATPGAPETGPASAPVTPGVPRQAAPPAAEDDRSTTRRELRERDRRRVSEAAPQASDGPTAADVDPSTPRPHVEAAGAHPAAHEDDVDHHEPHRYTWPHVLALAAVALVLGFLVWSQTTHPSGTGAVGAASPTTSPSAPPAAPRGEL